MTEAMPAGSKAEPISDSGSTSEIITQLRRRKNIGWATAAREERNKNMWDNYSGTKVTEGEGGGDAGSSGAEIPLQSMVKTMMKSREMRPWGSGSVKLISSERVKFERLFHSLFWLPNLLLGK